MLKHHHHGPRLEIGVKVDLLIGILFSDCIGSERQERDEDSETGCNTLLFFDVAICFIIM